MEPSTISVGSMGTGSGGGYSHTPTFRTTIINVVRIESQVLEKDIILKSYYSKVKYFNYSRIYRKWTWSDSIKMLSA